MTVTYAIKALPSSAADVNLDMYGYDASLWSPIASDNTNPRRARKVFQLGTTSREFPVTMERFSDRTQRVSNLPSVKFGTQIIAPVTASDSVTGLEVGAGQCRTRIEIQVTDVDSITPAMIVKELLAAVDALIPTITSGAADATVIGSLMVGNVDKLE